MDDVPRSHQCLITALVAVQEQTPSPEELRYAFKRFREITGIRRPMRPQRLPKYYTLAEVYALIEGAGKCSPKHRLLVDCLIHTGLRISEFRLGTVNQALDACRGNMSRAAGMLGVHRSTLYRWMAEKQQSAAV